MARSTAALLAALGLLLLAPIGAPAQAPTPPGPPLAGPGSEDAAITLAVLASPGRAGDAADGSEVRWWVPARLRDGDRAPVVVVLHGFAAPYPGLYGGLIRHLLRQGLVVVFPTFQLPLARIAEDTDQNAMLARAQAAVRTALAAIGPAADARRLTIVGHSLGGLLGAVWNAAGGPTAGALVLDHPSLAGTPYAAPDAFAPPVPVTPVDVGRLAPRVRAPAQVLTGDADRIAPPSEAVALGRLLGGPVAVWEARSDDHGVPPLRAGHLAPLSGLLTTDALDWRFSWAAVDLAVRGRMASGFDLGAWSDGVPVLAPVRREDG